MSVSLKDWLSLIELHGSVRTAAKSQGISAEAVSKKFRKLPDSDPIKEQYKTLTETTKYKRRAKKYPDRATGNRIRQQRWREKQEKS